MFCTLTELWGVVNNAGLNSDGDIELLTIDQFELINNVNYLGMVRVTKAFIPLVRACRGKLAEGMFKLNKQIHNYCFKPLKVMVSVI